MKLLSQIPKGELKDKVILLRAGLNLPLAKEQHTGESTDIVVDDFRITKALPTIKYLAEHAKQLIIIAHIGRGRDETLAPIAKELQKYLPTLKFAQWSQGVSDHKLVLMENVRQDPREVVVDGDIRASFAQEIIKTTGADIFVQDAFSVCHRSHASIVNLPKLVPSYAGLLVEQEVKMLKRALSPQRPAIFVLGGAKFATKEPLIRKFLKVYDRIFIGGAIANEFFESRGYEIGRSLVHEGKIPHDILYNDRIILPKTVRVADSGGHTIYVSPKDVAPNMKIVDAVPPSDLLTEPHARFVLWNGPLGYYEGGFSEGTEKLLDMLRGSDAEMFTGGGDTLATVGKGSRDIFTHISAGGGAMLTYLQDGTLVGIKALD